MLYIGLLIVAEYAFLFLVSFLALFQAVISSTPTDRIYGYPSLVYLMVVIPSSSLYALQVG